MLPLLRANCLSLALENQQSYAAKHLTRVHTAPFRGNVSQERRRCLSNQITTASLRVVILLGGGAFQPPCFPPPFFIYQCEVSSKKVFSKKLRLRMMNRDAFNAMNVSE